MISESLSYLRKSDDPRRNPLAVWVPDYPLFAIAQIVSNDIRRGRITKSETIAVYGFAILCYFAVWFCLLASAKTMVGIDLVKKRIEYPPVSLVVVSVDLDTNNPLPVVKGAAGALAAVAFKTMGNLVVIPREFDSCGFKLLQLWPVRGDLSCIRWQTIDHSPRILDLSLIHRPWSGHDRVALVR